MKRLGILVFSCLAAWAQNAPKPAAAPPASPGPNIPDEAVIAVFDDGVKVTMRDFRNLVNVLPQQNQQMAMQNRRVFVEQWALMRKLAKEAETQKLDQTSPMKEQLEYDRMNILSQAAINQVLNGASVPPAELTKFYESNKDNYKQVRVKAIYVSFGDSSARKLTEEQAKAKAAKLLEQIHGGADFIKLVKENSDDETSRAKDGDFLMLRRQDNIPDALRTAIFALKKGEVTEPVRQPNGYYLLRAEDVSYRPLPEVQDEVFMAVRQQEFAKWLEQEKAAARVDFPNFDFAAESVTVPLPLPAPPAKKK